MLTELVRWYPGPKESLKNLKKGRNLVLEQIASDFCPWVFLLLTPSHHMTNDESDHIDHMTNPHMGFPC